MVNSHSEQIRLLSEKNSLTFSVQSGERSEASPGSSAKEAKAWKDGNTSAVTHNPGATWLDSS